MRLRLAFWRSRQSPNFRSIYTLSFLFVLHTFLVTYINSTYLEGYLSPEGVGALFAVGSALSVLGFIFISQALRALGNVYLTLVLAVLEIIALVVMGTTTVTANAIIAFVVFIAINPLIFLSIDIFQETLIGDDETHTGQTRGLILSLMSLASVVGTVLMGIIVGRDTNLSMVYYTAAGIMAIFTLFLISRLCTFADPEYKQHRFRSVLFTIWHNQNLRYVNLSHLLLQIFFVWMVIYLPIHLITNIGLSWSEVSIAIGAGLAVFALFDGPIGYIADRFIGEKEMMGLGFVILATASFTMAVINTSAVAAWIILMVASRFGGALVEATTEGYFFKQTNGSDAGVISFFRLLRPLSSLLGALIGSAALLYLPLNLTFVVLAILMLPGILFALALVDTK